MLMLLVTPAVQSQNISARPNQVKYLEKLMCAPKVQAVSNEIEYTFAEMVKTSPSIEAQQRMRGVLAFYLLTEDKLDKMKNVCSQALEVTNHLEYNESERDHRNFQEMIQWKGIESYFDSIPKRN